MKTSTFPKIAHHEQGAVLILGLVLLMALTIVGVASMSNNTLQSRMAGNLADSNLAFNAAETASRALLASVNPETVATDSCQGASFDGINDATCILVKGDSLNGRSDINWMKDNNHLWWTSPTGGGQNFTQEFTGNYTAKIGGYDLIKTAPQAIIEEHSTEQTGQGLSRRDLIQNTTKYYRITIRATGSSDNSQAVIQQIVAK